MRTPPATPASSLLVTRTLIGVTAGGGALICTLGSVGGHGWGLVAGVAVTWGLFLSGLAEMYRRDQQEERALALVPHSTGEGGAEISVRLG